MFAFSQIEPQTTGRISKWDIPLNRWLGVKFGEAYDSTIGQAWERNVDRWFAEGDLLSVEQANERYKLPTLKFDEPVREQEAHFRYERKKAELARLAYLEAASHSVLSGKALAGFGASLLGSFSHPIDAATIFLPIVGSSARAAQLGRAGAGSLRRAFARGLITTEQIANISRFPKFTSAVVEGTIGQAIVEVPVYIQKRRDSAIYGIEDALFNVAAGGAFAGAVHAGVKGLSKVIERTARAHSQLTPEIKELLLREHVAAFAEGRTPNVRDYVQVDENAIRARVAKELGADVAEFVTAKGSIYRLHSDGTTTRNKSYHPEHGTSDVGIKPRSERTFFVTEADAIKLAEIQAQGGPRRVIAQLNDGRIGVKYLDGKDAGAFEARTVVEPKQPEVGDIPVELWDGGAKIHFGNKIIEIREAANQQLELRLNDERKAAIQEVIARKKQEFDAQKESRVKAEVAAEIARQQAEGKILPPEMVKQYSKAPGESAEQSSFLDNDISTLEQDLKADNERRIADLTDEEKAAVKEELDAELAAIKEEVYEPKTKAVEAALPCVLEQLRNG